MPPSASFPGLRSASQRVGLLSHWLMARLRQKVRGEAPPLRGPGPDRPRVVLFIGHHKVGSSSLQDFLSRNALALLRAGILYPSVEMQGHALMLAAALRGHDGMTALPLNLREAHNALAFRMMSEHKQTEPPAHHPNLPGSDQMLLAIRHQMEALRPEAVVLCAEVFSNFAATDIGMIERLRDFFAGCDVTLMATLRRPDEYLVSWESQRMKFGQSSQPLRHPRRLVWTSRNIHLNYELMLRGWIETFPEARIVLRDYAEVMQAGGSIADFQAQSGLDFPQGLMPVPRSNPSIKVALLEIMRRINETFPGPAAHRLRDAVQTQAKQLDLPANGEIEMFGAENRQQLMELFAPSNAYLQQVTGKTAFFADYDRIAEPRPLPQLDVSRAALEGLKPLIAATDLPEDMRAFIAGLEL